MGAGTSRQLSKASLAAATARSASALVDRGRRRSARRWRGCGSRRSLARLDPLAGDVVAVCSAVAAIRYLRSLLSAESASRPSWPTRAFQRCQRSSSSSGSSPRPSRRTCRPTVPSTRYWYHEISQATVTTTSGRAPRERYDRDARLAQALGDARDGAPVGALVEGLDTVARRHGQRVGALGGRRLSGLGRGLLRRSAHHADEARQRARAARRLGLDRRRRRSALAQPTTTVRLDRAEAADACLEAADPVGLDALAEEQRPAADRAGDDGVVPADLHREVVSLDDARPAGSARPAAAPGVSTSREA